MNYNPYFIPYAMPSTNSAGLISSLFGRSFSFSSILNGTSKVLNVVNQTIPLIKQASPIIKNTKTMFKIMNEFKKSDSKTDNINNNESINNNYNETYEKTNTTQINNEGPTFFM